MEKIRFMCATRVTDDEFDHCALGQSLQTMQVMPMFERRVFCNNQAAQGGLYTIRRLMRRGMTSPYWYLFMMMCFARFFMASHLYASLQRFDLVGVAGNTQRIARQPGWYYRGMDDTEKNP